MTLLLRHVSAVNFQNVLHSFTFYWPNPWTISSHTDRCKCTILGDPELESFDNMVMLMGYPNDVNRRFTMTKNVFNISDPCSFDVEVELGPVDNKYGMQFLETLPQALYIKMLGNLITLRPDNRASVSVTIMASQHFFPALLALCERNPSITGNLPLQWSCKALTLPFSLAWTRCWTNMQPSS